MGSEVHALGPMELVRGDEVIRVTSRRQQILLAMLVLRRGGVVSVPELEAALWPAEPPASGPKSVQIHVHRLRQAIGDRSAVRHRPPGYALALPLASVDVFRFEELAQRGRAALVRGEMAVAADLFRQAEALYRGPAFQGLAEVHELAVESRRVEELRLAAVEDRVAAELELDHHAGVIAELAALVSEHPLRERFRAQLMVALYRSGRQADALAAYRDGRRILVEEHGVEPNQECQGLERAILADDPELLRSGPAPARVETPVPRQLPTDVAGFTGRVQQLLALDGHLRSAFAGRSGICVISAVEGMAGVGKTALALHWAHRVRDRFPDGQLYVNLRGYAAGLPLPPQQALARFLRALGVPDEDVPADVDEAAGMYRTRLAGKRLLVVLDNAADPEQVRPILPGGGQCAVLVTSRSRLAGLVARDGAVGIVLDVLPDDEAIALLSRFLGDAAVEADPIAAAELVKLCGGLPLALRIAAARIATQPGLTVAGYLAQLRGADRLAALAVAGDEHAAVRATFDLSYRRLPDSTRRAFRRLGLVPGPDLTAAALAALTETPAEEAQRELAALAGAHLLEEHASGRYVCHDLLRAYAREVALAAEPAAARHAALARLDEYYHAGAVAAAKLLYPFHLLATTDDPPTSTLVDIPDRAAAIGWLDAELPNLAATAAHAAGDAGRRATAWWLADALRGYIQLRAPVADGMVINQAALVAAQAAGERAAEGVARYGRAGLYYRQGDARPAAAELGGALAAFRAAGRADGQAETLGNLGIVHARLGQMRRAADCFAEAVAMYEQMGSEPGQAIMNSQMAAMLIKLGRLRDADLRARQAAGCLAEQRPGYMEALNLATLGWLHHLMGELGPARRWYTLAQTTFRAIGDRNGEGTTLCGLAEIHCDLFQPAPSRELALAALRIAQDISHRTGEAVSRMVLARVDHLCGDHPAAAEASQRALELARRARDPYYECEALLRLATSYQPAPDQRPTAIACVDRALALTRQAGFRLLEGQALSASAAISVAGGDLDRALHDAEEALSVHRETGHRPGEARIHAVLSQARHRAGDAAAARSHRERASRLFGEMGIPAAAAGG